MKKITLLLVLAISTQVLFAQNSSITVFSEAGDPFYVLLNSVRQNENPSTNIRIDNLTNTHYTAEIVFANTSIPGIKKNMLMAVDVDGNWGDVTYKIKEKGNGKLVLRYFSFTPYQTEPLIPSNLTVIHYNTVPMPAIVTSTTTQTTTTTNGTGDNVNVGVNVGGVSIGMDVSINDGMSGSSTTTTQTTTTTSSTIPNEVIVVEEDCYAMHPGDFKGALASIESKTFSDSKLTLAKQVVKRNCLTAGQISKITKLFDFESTRLEFAKFAYAFCYNPENYWKVNDAFEFESSIEELDEYIEQRN